MPSISIVDCRKKIQTMAILGAHMSIAGGYYKAVEAAHRAGCDCVQVFTKNNNQWRAKPISDDDVDRFRGAIKELKISHPVSHASYLINLASPKDELWKKSLDSMVVELQRAGRLGIPYVVFHPGAFVDSSESKGIRRVIKALNEIHNQTGDDDAECLLETTAGQGTCLGWKFEHLGAMIDGVKQPERLGVCVDTCHIFAAGYPMGTEDEYESTVKALKKHVGLKKIKAFHLNDSVKPLGSRVDRHAHIGRGELGMKPFRFLLNDSRFAKVPMYLETAKGEEDGVDLDVINLKRLRRMVKKK